MLSGKPLGGPYWATPAEEEQHDENEGEFRRYPSQRVHD
jgi:hypothetical protein